jgi:hypothetical protein
MDGSLNQPSRVQDEGPMDCKLLLAETKPIIYGGVTVSAE